MHGIQPVKAELWEHRGKIAFRTTDTTQREIVSAAGAIQEIEEAQQAKA